MGRPFSMKRRPINIAAAVAVVARSVGRRTNRCDQKLRRDCSRTNAHSHPSQTNAAVEKDAGTGGDAVGSPSWREEEELQHELPTKKAMLTIYTRLDKD